MSKNLYEVLEVDPNASQDELQKAYRKKAMKYHPDRNNGDKDAEKKFKEAYEAYDVLKDPDKRTAYNQHIGISSISSRFSFDQFDNTDEYEMEIIHTPYGPRPKEGEYEKAIIFYAYKKNPHRAYVLFRKYLAALKLTGSFSIKEHPELIVAQQALFSCLTERVQGYIRRSQEGDKTRATKLFTAALNVAKQTGDTNQMNTLSLLGTQIERMQEHGENEFDFSDFNEYDGL